MECCHYDGDPKNNRLENLRWDTRKANKADAIRLGEQPRNEAQWNCKLSVADVRAIRSSTESQVVLAARHAVNQSTISRIRTGKKRRYVSTDL
jgi:hypothetical protein